MYEGTDTVILYDELAYEDVLPVGWMPVDGEFDAAAPARFEEANLRLLHACAVLDEQPSLPREKLDDNSPVALEIARLDFKISLLLDLVMALANRDLRRPDAVPIRFNSIGATFKSTKLRPPVGSSGVLHIYLRNSLPQPLALPARVIGVDDERVKVRFLPIAEGVSDLLDKLAFRRHRRSVAGSRKAR
jgi:hypothetical protein